MSLTSKGAALLAFVALVGEVLASYGWLGLRHQDAAAFLVIFAAAAVVFFLGLGLPKPIKGGSGSLMAREAPPIQGWQICEETTIRHERRVLIGPYPNRTRMAPEAARRALESWRADVNARDEVLADPHKALNE